jgi:hypothetical protein
MESTVLDVAAITPCSINLTHTPQQLPEPALPHRWSPLIAPLPCCLAAHSFSTEAEEEA